MIPTYALMFDWTYQTKNITSLFDCVTIQQYLDGNADSVVDANGDDDLKSNECRAIEIGDFSARDLATFKEQCRTKMCKATCGILLFCDELQFVPRIAITPGTFPTNLNSSVTSLFQAATRRSSLRTFFIYCQSSPLCWSKS